MKKLLLQRFKEPSTWAGLGILATLAGIAPSTFDLIQQVGIGLAGLAAVFMAEKAA